MATLGDVALRAGVSAMESLVVFVRCPVQFAASSFLFLLFILSTSEPVRSDDAVDRLSLSGPVNFNGDSYQLSWSSHPSPYYFKQEYLPAGQTSEHFQRMLLIEAIVRGTNVNGTVSAQVNMLNRRKSTDPIVNFAVFKNPKNGEVILDFTLSAETSKGETIVEWDAYR